MNSPIRILLVEDNPGDARVVAEALAESPADAFCMQWVNRLSAGIERLANGDIDVVLLDPCLPDSQGLQTLAAVRSAAPQVPVVVLSGMADEQFAVDAVQASAQDYLVKGCVDQHSLRHSLRYAIERKRAEEALRESEERLRLAMDIANEAIYECTWATGAVRFNDTYSRIFGRTVNEITTDWWKQRIHPEDSARVIGSWDAALGGTAKSWEAEYRLRRADGAWADIHDRALITRDAAGQPTRVVGALLDITERKRTQEALEAKNRQLRQLSSDLLRSQDYERRRIARELHDSTSQLLAALSMVLSRMAQSELPADRRDQAVSEAIELAAACSREVRTVTYLLHPPLLDQIGLAAALQAYAEGFTQRTGIQIEIKMAPDFGRLNCDMETTFFRIIQEGLANIHRHSDSPLAVIRLERDSREARLVVQDRGRGLPLAMRASKEGFVRFGVGILGMRERAEQLGGRLELTSNDLGTKLAVALPLVSNEENTSSASR